MHHAPRQRAGRLVSGTQDLSRSPRHLLRSTLHSDMNAQANLDPSAHMHLAPHPGLVHASQTRAHGTSSGQGTTSETHHRLETELDELEALRLIEHRKEGHVLAQETNQQNAWEVERLKAVVEQLLQQQAPTQQILQELVEEHKELQQDHDSAIASPSQSLTSRPFFHNGLHANSGFEMRFGYSTLGAGAQTRLESRMKKFTPHVFCRPPSPRLRNRSIPSKSMQRPPPKTCNRSAVSLPKRWTTRRTKRNDVSNSNATCALQTRMKPRHVNHILTSRPFFHNGTTSGFEMWFGTLGVGVKTRLESRIKKFTPHCICRPVL